MAEPGDVGLRIVPATTADAALVHRLMLAAFEEYRGRLQPPSSALAETVAEVARALAAGGAVIAWDGDTAVGCARYVLRPDHLEIGRVSVLPSHRRRGIATAMMRALAALAPVLGYRELRVEVRSALPANVALYAALGYEVVAEHPHPRDPSVTSVVMALRLP